MSSPAKFSSPSSPGSAALRFVKRSMISQIILFYVFICSGLIVNFLQLLTYIFIWPFNKKLYRKVNTHLAALFWYDLTFIAQYWSGSSVDLYCSDADFARVNREHMIVLMNHKYDVDWLMGWILCQRTGMLSGSKIVGKQALKYLPLIGWAWMFTESIFIQRKWETDKNLLTEGLDNILREYPDDHYFTILMFCEGTRFTLKKHADSMKVAAAKGMPLLKHHLLPRTKGFSLLAKGASGRVNSVYDLTIGIHEDETTKADFNTMRNGIPLKAEIYARRIPMSEVPKDDEGSAKFVQELYQKKDEIFETFEREGSFKSLGLPVQPTKSNFYDLYVFTMWTVLLCGPMLYYLFLFLKSAGLLAILTFFIAVYLVSFLCDKFISVTQSGHGSSYGLTRKNSNAAAASEKSKAD